MGTPHTNLGSLYPDEVKKITALRRAVADLYRNLGNQVTGRLTVGKERVLHSEQELRAAAGSLRLTSLQKERAYFDGVIDAFRLLKDPAVDTRLDDIVEQQRQVSQGIIVFHGPNGERTGGDILNAWLFGSVTHHDEQQRSILDEVSQFDDLAVFALQAAFVGRARVLIRLDTLCAEVLGEPPVWETVKPGDERFF